MNLTYIIVDDEEGSRDILSGFLKKYCLEAVKIGEAGNVEDAYTMICTVEPDLIFLDISMPGKNGFNLLEKFNNINFEIIFVTAYEEHARRAIKNNAVDYLLKPVGIIELKDAVGRAAQRIAATRALIDVARNTNTPAATGVSEKISVPVKDGYIYVNISDIIRCEADEGYTWIYFASKEKILVTKTLKQFDELLAAKKFVRVHHSHLINLNYVTKYNHGRGGQVVMSDGAIIDVSQRKRNEFLQRLGITE